MKHLPCLQKKRPVPHYPSFWSWFSHTLKYIVYVIIHALFSFLQYHVVWRLNGTLRLLIKNQRPENYDKSAQVLRIIFSFRYDAILQPVSLVDFFTVHEKFDHPERILKDNVDLYYVDDKQVLFTEAEEGVQQWRNAYGAFLRVVQHQQAIRVIILPLHTASRLSNKVGDPKTRLIFLSNTARCGGTLLGQVFERTGKCVVFSEPGAIQQISMYEQRKMKKEKLNKISRIVIRLTCKPVNFPKEVIAYVFKPIAATLDTIPAIQRVYPNAKHFFCYRDIEAMANAIQKLRNVCPLGRLIWLGGSKSSFLMKQLVTTGGMNSIKPIKFTHPTDIGAIIWAVSVRRYLDMRQQGVNIAGFFYGDLVKNKRFAVEKAFEFSGIPQELVDVGVRGLDRNSQENSGISTKELDQYVDCSIKSSDLISSGKILKVFDLARYEDGFLLEGTISTAPSYNSSSI